MADVSPDPVPASGVRVRHLVALAVWALILFLGLHFFTATKVLILGGLAAGSFAAAVYPLVRKMPGPYPLRGALAGILPILTLLATIGAIYWLLADSITSQVRQLPQLQERVNEVLATISTRLGLTDPIALQDLVDQVRAFLLGSRGGEFVATTASVLSWFFIALAFIFFGCLFFLIQPPQRLEQPLLRMVPPSRRQAFANATRDLAHGLRWWLIGVLISMTIVAVASGVGYSLVGLELAIPVGVLAGLGETVPTFGPFAAFLVALLFSATQGTDVMIGVVIVYLIVQVLESYLILPLVMRQAIDMPPILTLFTVVLWGAIFGAPGLLLALPLDLLVWSFVDHYLIRPRKPVDEDLLSDDG